MSAPSYSRHYETLMAVVIHLAVFKWAIRQPKGIAKDLSIPEADVKAVLKEFKGLFRESIKTTKDGSDHFYSLHLRYARQGEEDGQTEKGPLEAVYLFPLLDFISRKSAEETHKSSAFKVALTAASISLVSSVVSLIIAFSK